MSSGSPQLQSGTMEQLRIVRRSEDISGNRDRKKHTRIKNRRQMYLQRNPSYFSSSDLELADPLLYDRCIRRFQSAAEREAEGRSKGYSGVLEADLQRSEAKLAALAEQSVEALGNGHASANQNRHVTYVRGADGEVLPEDPDEIPQNKEEGVERWRDEMTLRFIRGEDEEFPYEDVDNNDEWDVIENREAEDQWFEEEQPAWVDEDKQRSGETGIQDF